MGATMHKDKALIVFAFSRQGSPSSTRYGGFARKLQKTGKFKDHDLLTVALENLIFVVRDDKSADVIDPVSGISLSKADFLYFKSRAQALGEADALAHFLQSRGIPFMDSRVLTIGDSKISTVFKLWADNIRVPETIYSRNQKNMLDYIRTNRIFAGEDFVVKDIYGSKGKNNFLVNSANVSKRLKQNPGVTFMAQKFIKNDGDYRIGVYAEKASFIIHRRGGEKTHLNNTSAGGMATYVKAEETPLKLRSLAEKAARASDLEVAGVDIIISKETAKAYVLEVNRGSQIVTGVFIDQNIDAFSDAILNQVKKRHAKSRQKPMTIVGRRARVKLPKLGILDAVAKIDSGAYTSTLHAHKIRIEKGELVFEIQPKDGYETDNDRTQVVRIQDYFTQKVRSSNGQLQTRYSFKTRMSVGGKQITATLTLSNRSNMGYPLLIGRRVIRSRFLINVEFNEENKKEWKF